MNANSRLHAVLIVVLLANSLPAQVPVQRSPEQTGVNDKQWSMTATVSGYIVPDDQSYVSPTFAADHQRLHLEARYNYEEMQTGSLWAGYNFSTGEKIALSFTPMIGGVFGHTAGIAPGYDLSVEWKKLELSTQGEFVFDFQQTSENFFYTWSELSYAPREWLRAGIVAQRTKVYRTGLDIQRGLLIGFSGKNVDFTTYVFNFGWTIPTVVLAGSYRF